ncbi:hypothetical protein L6Q21_06300 [Sandaracinobacter sp. RS1-74]|uniref:hypothetical protein n=1 Tax=Sandaracinobacteroides sayramensis TaxID=2913411 RepID=UPI001EDA5F73|nr:hypothetical protein [Sandaracinobacteroides sayramensis]MCG2840589.1 hypothetical protein [Sandaracinobacteroides sayramensis]
MMLALSILAVLLLTGAVWAMGFRGRPALDEAAARDEAEGRLAGFRAGEVALADSGRGAVLRGLDGSFALLLPFGDSWLSRRLPPETPLDWRDGSLNVRLAEPMLAEAHLPLAQPPLWLREARP